MARKVKISGGVLNIRIHPHPAGIYEEFIRSVFALKRAVKIHGDRHAILSILNSRDNGVGIYTGTITTFTNVDMDEPWFDISSLKEASNQQVSQISIPKGLHPNSNSFYFIFNTNNHRIYVQTYARGGKTLSIKSAQKLFENLSKDLNLDRKFNKAVIDVVQSKFGLDHVFSLKVIKKITITLNKPNADVFEDGFDENLEDFLEKTNSKRLTVVLEAEPGESIKPNAEVKRVSKAALDVGSVTAIGRDDLGATERSTEAFPEHLHDKFDPEAVTEQEAFRRLAGQ